MNWDGGLISDSGGFQLMSLIKQNDGGKVVDEGIKVKTGKSKVTMFTPEDSIRTQMEIGADMMVVLDDFTMPEASYEEAKETVRRTILWAKRSKDEFEKQCLKRGLKGKRIPYLLGVVQGGYFEELRRECARELAKIGFDGFGYGGWPLLPNGEFDTKSGEIIAEEAPEGYFLYGLGIGKPEDIVKCVNLKYNIFDCVLPSRDARHGRLYVFDDFKSDEKLDEEGGFYKFWSPRERDLTDSSPIDPHCDCLTCRSYSRGYLAHLFRIKEMSAGRLATIHNLRFYSRLMEKLRKE